MTTHPHGYIRTIDTVVDAVQFTDADFAAAIVLWITDHVRDQPGAGAKYDSVRNVIALPSAARPRYVEVGWWVVRWPSGEFGAYCPATIASMFDQPAYPGYLPDIRAGRQPDCADRDIGGTVPVCCWPAGCPRARPDAGPSLEPVKEIDGR